MKSFRNFMTKEEYSKSKYYEQPDGSWKRGGDGRSEGKTKGELPKGVKISEDAQNVAHLTREEYFAEISDKLKRRYLDIAKKKLGEDSPAMNTSAVPGAGSDNSLHMKRARLFKGIYRRFHTIKQNTKLGVPK